MSEEIVEIVGKFYYPQVVEDIDKVIEAIDYYRHVQTHGHRHMKLKGVIERLLMEQPGLMKVYKDAQIDCAMVHKWLEEQIKHMKAKKRIYFLTDIEAKSIFGDLKKTEIDSLVAADDTIFHYVELQLMVELWCNSLDNLVNRLRERSISLTMISKLRIAGEREAYIDASHETSPDHLM